MDKTFIPSPQDDVAKMEDAITKTATFNGTSYDNGVGFLQGGIGLPVGAVINVTALDFTTGDETYVLVLQESADNGTFTDCGPAVPITVVGNFCIPGFVTQRYCRLKQTLAGTTPSLSLSAWLTPLDMS